MLGPRFFFQHVTRFFSRRLTWIILIGGQRTVVRIPTGFSTPVVHVGGRGQVAARGVLSHGYSEAFPQNVRKVMSKTWGSPSPK